MWRTRQTCHWDPELKMRIFLNNLSTHTHTHKHNALRKTAARCRREPLGPVLLLVLKLHRQRWQSSRKSHLLALARRTCEMSVFNIGRYRPCSALGSNLHLRLRQSHLSIKFGKTIAVSGKAKPQQGLSMACPLEVSYAPVDFSCLLWGFLKQGLAL